MRPTFGWDELTSFARIGVWGLGVEGTATRRRLEALGIQPVLVDDRPSNANVIPTRPDGIEALRRCDLVIKSPGISRHRPDVVELEASTPIVGAIGLWMNSVDTSRVICVTGTKGKSTTTSIAAHLARGLGINARVVGNIGTPPFDPDEPQDCDLWLLEVSSYQATDLGRTPPVVGVTSIGLDHVDWHVDETRYVADKLSMTTQLGARTTVCPDVPNLHRVRHLLGPSVVWVRSEDAADWADELGLVGEHNLVNAAIAARLLIEAGCCSADSQVLREAAAGFQPLESRLQLVATTNGVRCYDDGLSTNVLPTIAALDAFVHDRVAILLGGFDRGIDYRPLARHLAARNIETLALTMPDNGPRIALALRDAGVTLLEEHSSLESAVRRGIEWARPDGVVLLSPAAPSFGHFRDYRERGAAFAHQVRSYAESG